MYSILGLSPLLQLFLVVAIFGFVGILGPALVRRRALSLKEKDHHDVLGIMFSVAAAFYGVVLAFVIVAAWQDFQDASSHEQAESLALTELFAMSTHFPEPVRDPMIGAIRAYVNDALKYEWAGQPRVTPARHDLIRMLAILLSMNPQTQKQGILYGKAMDQLTRLFEARQERLLYSSSNIPTIVWMVIGFGAMVTIILSFFFFTQHRVLQAFTSMLFTMLIGLTIIAIYDLSHPYQGFTRISPTGFKELLHEIDTYTPLPELSIPAAPLVSPPAR
jgi:hypothetical protein